MTGTLALLVLLAGGAAAQEAPTAWAVEKCARYRAAWAAVVAGRGTGGLGAAFLADHAAFLAAGCTTRGAVCPRSPAEVEVADLLTVMAMNEGMASTFLPFRCGG
jgi:hypothetical protein